MSLNDAAQLHRDLYAFHSGLSQAQRNKMLVIAGVGFDTLFRLEYKRLAVKGRWVVWDRMVKVTQQNPADLNRLGDGRVPVPSAALEHVGDTRYVRGVHSSLPNIPAVYQDVFRWFKGQPLQLPTTPAAGLARVLGPATSASPTPTLDGSAIARGDDPGYLDLGQPDPAHIEKLIGDLAAGRLPEFRFISIL